MNNKIFSAFVAILLGCLVVSMIYLIYRDTMRITYIPLTDDEVANIVKKQFESYESSQLQEDAIINAIEKGFNID